MFCNFYVCFILVLTLFIEQAINICYANGFLNHWSNSRCEVSLPKVYPFTLIWLRDFSVNAAREIMFL